MSRKGVFIPDITVEMFKKATLESVEEFMASGQMEDIEIPDRPHGECNQCRYYDGVRGVQGHAPCWHWNIGGVMWNDYCSRFEKEGDENCSE